MRRPRIVPDSRTVHLLNRARMWQTPWRSPPPRRPSSRLYFSRPILFVSACSLLTSSVLWDRTVLLGYVRASVASWCSRGPPGLFTTIVLAVAHAAVAFVASPLAPEVAKQAASILGFVGGWAVGVFAGLIGGCLAFSAGSWLLKGPAERALDVHPRGRRVIQRCGSGPRAGSW